MTPDIAELREALQNCVDLIENWAYGPLFEKAGIVWPGGVCCADALVNAKRLLENEQPCEHQYAGDAHGMNVRCIVCGAPPPAA